MDFRLSDDQTAMLDGVARILDRQAGTDRAMELERTSGYDFALHEALESSGYFDAARGAGGDCLDAALIVEAIARAVGTVAAGAATLVVPRLDVDVPRGPVALAVRGPAPLIRYATAARSLLALDHGTALLVELRDGDVAPVRSTFGHPVGRVSDHVWLRAVPLGHDAGLTLLRWWQVALAVEIAALMDGALRSTVDHVNARHQFGHPISAFQAVQHRLAECAVLTQGSLWHARQAADLGASPEIAASACAYASTSARHVFAETHQLSGAIGFTNVFPLHLWTTRAMGLTLELGGPDAHAREVARQRWDG